MLNISYTQRHTYAHMHTHAWENWPEIPATPHWKGSPTGNGIPIWE